MWIWENYTADSYSDEERIVPHNYQTYGDSLTKDDIDVIAKRPNINKIEFVGLRQAEFEYFIEKWGNQFESISLFKCPFISDFSPLESLAMVKHINIFWNNKATKLWDMSKNIELKSLSVQDFKGFECVEHLFDGALIEELVFGGHPFAGNQKYISTNLNFLAKITTLRFLSIDSIFCKELNFTWVTKLSNLKKFEFPTKQFTTEQVAWLSSRMPVLRINAWIPLTIQTMIGKDEWEETKCCQILGKRKPMLTFGIEDERIKKHEETFKELVKYYSENTQLPCP